jgi:hypothetical protein
MSLRRRTGLGRHGHGEDATGDPLDGLVNLFDIGIVLAVAFLVAGIGLTLNQRVNERSHNPQTLAAPVTRDTVTQHTQTLPSPVGAPSASGHGQPVGTVYRLGNGQLVYVQKER